MDIAVIGAGYVGAACAACLASLGHRVQVGERDPARVERLLEAKSDIHEPGLDSAVAAGLASGLLSFHGNNAVAVEGAEIVFLALPTPSTPDGSADLSIIEAVLRETASSLQRGAIVAAKSTVPVGSYDRMTAILSDLGADAFVASNPEFLRAGSALDDFLNPDRIVIGTHEASVAEKMTELYRSIGAPVLVTDPASAEMIKYASNAYLATRVAFANTIADICEAAGADISDVLKGMGMDKRIGSHFLKPGPGFGGSCLPKDTRALVAIGSEAGFDADLIASVIRSNRSHTDAIVTKILTVIGNTSSPRVGLWGLAFKAGTGDVRESPAVHIGASLIDQGVTVTAFDPMVTKPPAPGFEMAADAVGAASQVDVLVIGTEWPEFADVELGPVADSMRGTAIIDARNIINQQDAEAAGLTYMGVGR